LAILLVPGFMTDHDLWRDLGSDLAAFGPLSHADLSRDDSIEGMARRALTEAPLSFILIGFSMGGYVAREMVRLAPRRVRALVLVATSARGDTEAQKQRKAAFAQASTTAFAGLSRSAVMSSLHPDRAGDEGMIERVRAMSTRLGGDVFRRQSLLKRNEDLSRLSEIRCSTLIIAAAQDRLRSLDEAKELHNGIAGSTLEIIQDCGHMIPVEAPLHLAQAIVRWLNSRLT
jgi:pimeloyl-ACP methyl ester carboxylesterase